MIAQREWLEKDYYKVLGVEEKASDTQITKAYRKLARKLHPDANPDDSEAEKRFKEVSAAYDVLGDTERRSEYDDLRRFGPMGGFQPGSRNSGGMPFDLGDLFGGLFNHTNQTESRRGADLETNLTLSFEDAARGVTASVTLLRDVSCSVCSGSGAQPGSSPKICELCGGHGNQIDDQGVFSLSRPCRHCGGRGQRIDNPCGSCKGSGIERKPQTVKVRIPIGVEDGQRIRVKGQGASGQGSLRGDLYVEVDVKPHQIFNRQGYDLTLAIPVSFSEAVLGADIEIPTLEKNSVILRVPSGTPTGQTFRVHGHGLSTQRGQGDLLVTVEVEVPSEITEEQRMAIESLATATKEIPRDYLTKWLKEKTDEF